MLLVWSLLSSRHDHELLERGSAAALLACLAGVVCQWWLVNHRKVQWMVTNMLNVLCSLFGQWLSSVCGCMPTYCKYTCTLVIGGSILINAHFTLTSAHALCLNCALSPCMQRKCYRWVLHWRRFRNRSQKIATTKFVLRTCCWRENPVHR